MPKDPWTSGGTPGDVRLRSLLKCAKSLFRYFLAMAEAVDRILLEDAPVEVASNSEYAEIREGKARILLPKGNEVMFVTYQYHRCTSLGVL